MLSKAFAESGLQDLLQHLGTYLASPNQCGLLTFAWNTILSDEICMLRRLTKQ
ncbi:hypothetical protein CSPX01_08120 [Colletotrichum filicis]|nr:hypothetical protein CSPX01_08120 [Colletotrichum filicis]